MPCAFASIIHDARHAKTLRVNWSRGRILSLMPLQETWLHW